MTGRTTRSKQKQEESASLSPARSTRSAVRSGSPALKVSSKVSPARSSSPATSRNQSAPRGRGRGRGRGTSREQNLAPNSPGRVTRSAKAVPDNSPSLKPSGPIRGRGRSRNKREVTDRSLDSSLSVVVHKEEESEETELGSRSEVNIPAKELETAENLDSKPCSAEQERVIDKDSSCTNQDTSGLKEDSIEKEDNSCETVQDSAKIEAQEDEEGKTSPTADEAIAELANHLASGNNDDWTPSDKAVLTDEHIKQIESVLTSENGLAMLTDRQTNSEINELPFDDIQVRLMFYPHYLYL